MTLSTTSSKISYAGNGSTTQFAVPFKFLKNSHIVAILRTDATGAEASWTEGADYTLTGAGVQAGGTLTATTAPASGMTLVIRRIVPESQAVDLPLGGALPSSTIEDMVDRLTMMVQAHSAEIARTILLKATSPTSGLVLPEPEADKLLGWNAGGTNLENKAAGAGGGVTDHGALTGLGDDDHAQYHTDGRALTWLGTRDTDDLPEGAANAYYPAAAQLLTDLKTVDGAASGLDADLLDGQQASAFAGVAHTHTLVDITDEGALAALNTVDTAQIDNNAVTLAKLADMATASFIGRNTAATGDPEVLSAATARTILNVEAGADVTDTTNVAAAGAVMDGDFGANGLAIRTGAGAYTNRTLTGTANKVTVTNGDGVSGNPTVDLPNPLNLADGVLQRPEIKDFSITKKTATAHTGSVTINAQDGNVYVDTGVTGNLTLDVSNWPAGYGKIDVWLKSNVTGGWTITLTGFTWATTAAAALTASKWTRFVLETPDGGTTKIATLIAEGF